jgi:sugar phosphate isomerase/epimerase
VLQSLAAVGGAALLPACAAADDRSRGASWLPGLQLYTLGEAPARDLAGILRQVATIGYRAVELAGDYQRSARQLREALDEAGLVCPSMHLGWEALDGDPARLAEQVTTIGVRYVVMPGPSLSDETWEQMRQATQAPARGRSTLLSSDDWKRTADLLNEKGAKLAHIGVRLAYHNHAWEFVPLADGGTGYDLLVERTDPALVDFQLDTGWVVSAGQDPLALLDRLGPRLRLMHLKDVKQPSSDAFRMVPADVGTGIVDWVRLIPAIRRARVPHLFVEQEPPFPVSRMASVRVAYDFLSAAFTKAG